MIRILMFSVAAACLMASQANATGLATCNSGPKSAWKPEAQLQKMLIGQGWQIRRIKEDGGCYEVYAIDGNGKRVETYFHPLTLEVVPTSKTN